MIDFEVKLCFIICVDFVKLTNRENACVEWESTADRFLVEENISLPFQNQSHWNSQVVPSKKYDK